MNTIILPIDFSNSTDILIDGAVKFAQQVNGKIFLIHVAPIDLGFTISDMGFQYFPEIENNELKKEWEELYKLKNKISKQGIPCEHTLQQGIAKDIILNFAKEKNAEYIVMGSHGRSGLYDVFIGSLTKELTKKSSIPVLIIPCHFE